jgi:uroporphyrinogen-III decarboxylase
MSELGNDNVIPLDSIRVRDEWIRNLDHFSYHKYYLEYMSTVDSQFIEYEGDFPIDISPHGSQNFINFLDTKRKGDET